MTDEQKRERSSTYNRKYYAARAEELKKRSHEYYWVHREHCLAQSRKNYADKRNWDEPARRLGRLVNSARSRAKRKNLAFDNAFTENILSDPPTQCPCCGCPLDYSTGTGQTERDKSPSLDRVDNTKGYVPGNVQVVCMRCNMRKSNLNLDELKAIVAYVERHAVSA